MPKYTRADYMRGDVSHQDYYAQFATIAVIACVTARIGKARIQASKDEYFNDIPLAEWDELDGQIRAYVGRRIAEANSGGVSLADTVCVAKAAARLIKASKEPT